MYSGDSVPSQSIAAATSCAVAKRFEITDCLNMDFSASEIVASMSVSVGLAATALTKIPSAPKISHSFLWR
jgi:hypothetical protein